MGRLFSGTPWDRPPTCDRCGQLESACQCPTLVAQPARKPPEVQTARLRVEKRPKGKLVTSVTGLDPADCDLEGLASQLKARCGSGGTVKDAAIEIQGAHLDAVDAALKAIGLKTRRT